MRWIAMPSAEGPGGYWCLYEGSPEHPRKLLATVCKTVRRWRGYVHAQRSPDGRRDVARAKRSLSKESAQAAARWVVEQLKIDGLARARQEGA